MGSAGQSDFYSPLLPLFSGYTKIRNSELGPVLLKFALFNGVRPSKHLKSHLAPRVSDVFADGSFRAPRE